MGKEPGGLLALGVLSQLSVKDYPLLDTRVTTTKELLKALNIGQIDLLECHLAADGVLN